MVSIVPHFLGSRSPPALLFGDSSALNQFNQTKDAPTFYKVRLPTLQNAEDRHCVFSVEADIIINCCFQLLSHRPPLASPSQNLLPHSPLLHPSPPSPCPPPPPPPSPPSPQSTPSATSLWLYQCLHGVKLRYTSGH